MHTISPVAAAALFFAAGVASASCIDNPRECLDKSGAAVASNYCIENPQACMNRDAAAPTRSFLQRLLDRLREQQPKLTTVDTTQPAR